MSKSFDYLKIITNKCGLFLGIPYAKIRFSDSIIYKYKLNNTSKIIFDELINLHSELVKQYSFSFKSIKKIWIIF